MSKLTMSGKKPPDKPQNDPGGTPPHYKPLTEAISDSEHNLEVERSSVAPQIQDASSSTMLDEPADQPLPVSRSSSVASTTTHGESADDEEVDDDPPPSQPERRDSGSSLFRPDPVHFTALSTFGRGMGVVQPGQPTTGNPVGLAQDNLQQVLVHMPVTTGETAANMTVVDPNVVLPGQLPGTSTAQDGRTRYTPTPSGSQAAATASATSLTDEVITVSSQEEDMDTLPARSPSHTEDGGSSEEEETDELDTSRFLPFENMSGSFWQGLVRQRCKITPPNNLVLSEGLEGALQASATVVRMIETNMLSRKMTDTYVEKISKSTAQMSGRRILQPWQWDKFLPDLPLAQTILHVDDFAKVYPTPVPRLRAADLYPITGFHVGITSEAMKCFLGYFGRDPTSGDSDPPLDGDWVPDEALWPRIYDSKIEARKWWVPYQESRRDITGMTWCPPPMVANDNHPWWYKMYYKAAIEEPCVATWLPIVPCMGFPIPDQCRAEIKEDDNVDFIIYTFWDHSSLICYNEMPLALRPGNSVATLYLLHPSSKTYPSKMVEAKAFDIKSPQQLPGYMYHVAKFFVETRYDLRLEAVPLGAEETDGFKSLHKYLATTGQQPIHGSYHHYGFTDWACTPYAHDIEGWKTKFNDWSVLLTESGCESMVDPSFVPGEESDNEDPPGTPPPPPGTPPGSPPVTTPVNSPPHSPVRQGAQSPGVPVIVGNIITGQKTPIDLSKTPVVTKPELNPTVSLTPLDLSQQGTSSQETQEKSATRDWHEESPNIPTPDITQFTGFGPTDDTPGADEDGGSEAAKLQDDAQEEEEEHMEVQEEEEESAGEGDGIITKPKPRRRRGSKNKGNPRIIYSEDANKQKIASVPSITTILDPENEDHVEEIIRRTKDLGRTMDDIKPSAGMVHFYGGRASTNKGTTNCLTWQVGRPCPLREKGLCTYPASVISSIGEFRAHWAMIHRLNSSNLFMCRADECKVNPEHFCHNRSRCDVWESDMSSLLSHLAKRDHGNPGGTDFYKYMQCGSIAQKWMDSGARDDPLASEKAEFVGNVRARWEKDRQDCVGHITLDWQIHPSAIRLPQCAVGERRTKSLPTKMYWVWIKGQGSYDHDPRMQAGEIAFCPKPDTKFFKQMAKEEIYFVSDIPKRQENMAKQGIKSELSLKDMTYRGVKEKLDDNYKRRAYLEFYKEDYLVFSLQQYFGEGQEFKPWGKDGRLDAKGLVLPSRKVRQQLFSGIFPIKGLQFLQNSDWREELSHNNKHGKQTWRDRFSKQERHRSHDRSKKLPLGRKASPTPKQAPKSRKAESGQDTHAAQRMQLEQELFGDALCSHRFEHAIHRSLSSSKGSSEEDAQYMLEYKERYPKEHERIANLYLEDPDYPGPTLPENDYFTFEEWRQSVLEGPEVVEHDPGTGVDCRRVKVKKLMNPPAEVKPRRTTSRKGRKRVAESTSRSRSSSRQRRYESRERKGRSPERRNPGPPTPKSPKKSPGKPWSKGFKIPTKAEQKAKPTTLTEKFESVEGLPSGSQQRGATGGTPSATQAIASVAVALEKLKAQDDPKSKEGQKHFKDLAKKFALPQANLRGTNMGAIVIGSDSEGEDQKIHVDRRKNRLQQQQQQQPTKTNPKGGKNSKPKLDVPKDRSLSMITKEQKDQLMETDQGDKGNTNPPKPPKVSDQVDFPEASKTQMQSFLSDGQQAIYNRVSVTHERIDQPALPAPFPSRTSMAAMAVESSTLPRDDTRVQGMQRYFHDSTTQLQKILDEYRHHISMGTAALSEYSRYLIGENSKLESELDKQVQNAGSDTSQRQLLEREVADLRQQVAGAQAIVHQNCDSEHLDMANPCLPANHTITDGVPIVNVGDGSNKMPQHIPIFFPGGVVKFYDPKNTSVLMAAYTASFLAWQQHVATGSSQVMRHETPSARATRRLQNRAKKDKEKGAKK